MEKAEKNVVGGAPSQRENLNKCVNENVRVCVGNKKSRIVYVVLCVYGVLGETGEGEGVERIWE